MALYITCLPLPDLDPGVPSSPFAWYHIVVVILPVHNSILDCRISHAQEIVTADGSEDDIGRYLWLELDDNQQTGISVGQDTKSILTDSTAAASSVVVNPFWHIQAHSAIRLHHVGVQREGIITNKEIGVSLSSSGRWCGGRNPITCGSIACFRPQSSNICASDEVALAPTSTQVNL